MKCADAGFSLTELLICFSISMLLLLILIQHVLSVSRQYQHIHAVLDETVTLQWAFDVMRARIHHAGFTPCLGLNQLKTTDTRDKPELLQAIEVQSSNTPKLIVRKMDEKHFGLVQQLAPNTLHLSHDVLIPNRPVIIADCSHAEVHEIKHISQAKSGEIIQLKKPLVFEYGPEAYIGNWVSEAFFFRKSRGLFIQQQRVDYMAAAEHAEFELKKKQADFVVMMRLVSRLGKTYILEARPRM
ncbi:MAG: hypothetical protein K0U24_00815 [Gammaproteobacteria bacterium]|nr:hypothetical protein [Gammaproteobacteria bacterium]MCH9715937.1 hypothetical protein [Gammaproteobacteria bacterium]MCH9762769.1 hypothetical protein [Gammaproteobacteria bacterium]